MCPILVKQSLLVETPKLVSREVFGASEFILVGERSYPRVRFGPITAVSDRPWDPESWAREMLDFSEILRLRAH